MLALIRGAAIWIFGVLFSVSNVEQLLEQAIVDSLPPSPPQRDNTFDRAIDREFAMVDVAGQTFYASEVLFSIDYAAYREAGARLCEPQLQRDPKDASE